MSCVYIPGLQIFCHILISMLRVRIKADLTTAYLWFYFVKSEPLFSRFFVWTSLNWDHSLILRQIVFQSRQSFSVILIHGKFRLNISGDLPPRNNSIKFLPKRSIFHRKFRLNTSGDLPPSFSRIDLNKRTVFSQRRRFCHFLVIFTIKRSRFCIFLVIIRLK